MKIQIQALQVAIPSNSHLLWQAEKSYYATRIHQNFLETQDRNSTISVQKYSITRQVFFDPLIFKKPLPAALALVPYHSPTSSAAFSPSIPQKTNSRFNHVKFSFSLHMQKVININYMKSNFRHNCNQIIRVRITSYRNH